MAELQDVTMTSDNVVDPGTPTTPAPADDGATANKDGEATSTKWKHYPLRDKLRVVDFLRKMRERDHGHPEAATIAYFEKQEPPIFLTRKTVHKWEESRDKLAKALEDEENGEVPRKRPRKSKNPAVEAQLVNFCTWAEEQGIPVTGPLLKQKLKIYQERLGGVELVGSNGWLQAFYGYYGIKLAGCKEVKAAQRAIEDADFSDDPDGKKRRLRKRRAAAKRRRAAAKLAKQGGAAPGIPEQTEEEEEEDDNDDDGDESGDGHEQSNHVVPTARAPPQTAVPRSGPRRAARKTGAAGSKAGSKTAIRGKPVKSAAASGQPRTTTTMQIEHLTQQQQHHPSDPMMHWDNGNYQADYGDVDESGDDEYYPPAGFETGVAGATTTTATAMAANAAALDPSGWSILDSEKIGTVRTAATTLLGLALERSDVGLDNVQANMISVLEWCKKQDEVLSVTNNAVHAAPRAAAVPTYAQPIQAPTSSAASTSQHSSRLGTQFVANNSHTSQPSTASRQAYTGAHNTYANQYAPSSSSYSTLASAAAAAAPTTYQLPHNTTSYANPQGYQQNGQAQHTSYQHHHAYGTQQQQYGAQGYTSSHPYSSRLGI